MGTITVADHAAAAELATAAGELLLDVRGEGLEGDASEAGR